MHRYSKQVNCKALRIMNSIVGRQHFPVMVCEQVIRNSLRAQQMIQQNEATSHCNVSSAEPMASHNQTKSLSHTHTHTYTQSPQPSFLNCGQSRSASPNLQSGPLIA